MSDVIDTGEQWLTIVVPQFQLSKIVANHSVVSVVTAVVCRSSLLSRLTDTVHLIRLGWAEVLSLLWRSSATCVLRVAVPIVLFDLAVELFGEVADPFGYCLLCLLEALLDVLANLREVVCSFALLDTRAHAHVHVHEWAHLQRSYIRGQALRAADGCLAHAAVGCLNRPGSGSAEPVGAHRSRPAQAGCGAVDVVAVAEALPPP